MADPLPPPRPRKVQPPPLPSLPLVPEPFRNLTEDERAADTEPSGRARRDETPPPALDALTESTAQLLRQELALMREVYREQMPTVQSLAPPPLSVRTRSKAALAGIVTGKYAGVALLVGIVLRAVAKKWPEFGEVIEGVLQAVGL